VPYIFDRPVEFDVQGGLVLQELSLSFLRAWGKNWPERAPARLAIEAVTRTLREVGNPPERVVFVSKILPDPVNLGYEDVQNSIVVRANGRSIASLADFREALQHPVNSFDVVEFIPGQGRAKLVFKADALAVANRRIQDRYDIPPAPPSGAQISSRRERTDTTKYSGMQNLSSTSKALPHRKGGSRSAPTFKPSRVGQRACVGASAVSASGAVRCALSTAKLEKLAVMHR